MTTARLAESFATFALAVALGVGCGDDARPGDTRPPYDGPLFQTGVTAATGAYPNDLAVGDVDGDGQLELIVLNRGDGLGDGRGGVTVVRVRRGGALEAAEAIPVGHRPMALVSGDWNGDGHLDFATADYDDLRVSVLLGDGRGRFAVTTYGTGIRPVNLAAGDLDGDRRPELLVVNGIDGNNDSLNVLRNQGDGTFAAPRALTAGSFLLAVATADLDGDGDLDVVTCAGGNLERIYMLENDGGGRFVTTKFVSLGVIPEDVAIADLNGDGELDFVVATQFDQGVVIMFGEGAGTFTAAPTITTQGAVTQLAVADLTGEGQPDIVALRGVDVLVSLNYGTGFFAPAVRYAVVESASALALADLDGDGAVDLAATDAAPTADEMSGRVKVVFGLGPGRFEAPISYPGAQFATVGDITGDGLADLVSVGGYDGTAVWAGNGSGAFAPPTFVPFELTALGLTVADVDGDGWQDLIAAQPSGILVSPNDGAGAVTDLLQEHPGFPDGPIQAARVDADDAPDLVFSTAEGEVTILINDGAGDFPRAIHVVVGEGVSAFALADFNGDGWTDLVHAAHEEPFVAVRLGDGDGGFAAPRRVRAGGPVEAISVGDVDGDGGIDIVVGIPHRPFRMQAGRIAVLFNDGRSGFRDPAEFPVGGSPRAVSLQDLDADGTLDVAYGYEERTQIGVLLNDGAGAFGAPQVFDAGGLAYAIHAADVNGDAVSDLVVATLSGVVVLISQTGR
jgi:hypothetical protein